MRPQFRLKKTDISTVLLSFINLKGIETEEKQVLEETLHHFIGIDLVDAYLAAHAKAVSPPNIVSTNKKDKQLGVSVETPDKGDWDVVKEVDTAESEQVIAAHSSHLTVALTHLNDCVMRQFGE